MNLEYLEKMNQNHLKSKLKQRLKKEGNETVTNIHGLKMLAKDYAKELLNELKKNYQNYK